MLLFSLSMSLTSCDDILGEWSRPTPGNNTPSGGGSSTIAVTSVKLNEAYLRFDKNVLTAQTLTAIVAPDDATDKTVTWESSDESVATVDENGQVTPITKGTVTITATAHDGSGMKATSTVIVYDKIHDISTGAAAVTDNETWLIEGNSTDMYHFISIGAGATVTLNGINIVGQIRCSDTGNATIILADGSTNKVGSTGLGATAGIKIGGTGTTLTIDAETAGTGTLDVTGGNGVSGGAAGIGTDYAENVSVTGGNIIINGGTVTATGGNYGAGIGTGLAFTNTSFANITCGNITINGGTVIATGDYGGAGIGTGLAGGSYGAISITCGDITINGGTVIAQGGEGAAGIGTGLSSKASNKCGAITIGTGVTSVTAKKSSSTPGPNSIGEGDAADGGHQYCGTITIGGDATTYAAGVTTSPFTYPTAP